MARVLHLISSNERRGAEVFASELAEHLRAAGHEVRVLAVTRSSSPKVLDAEVAGRTRQDPAGFARTVRAARWADVVVSFGSTSLINGALAAKLAKRPFVYRNIGDPGVWGAARFARLRIGTPVRSAAAVVALYPGAKDTLITRYGLDPARVRIIPRGVPAHHFAPSDATAKARARERLGVPTERPLLAYIGSMSSEKDPMLAVETLAAVPEAGLVMAGGGPMLDEVRHALAVHGDRGVALGPVEDVRDVLAAADALILTSRTEGIPGAVIEAGLSGLPTVATRVGGVPHVVDDGRTGRLVDLDDRAGFAVATREVLASAPEWGRAAFAKCTAEYSMAEVGSRWEQVIADLAGAGPPASDDASTERAAVLQVIASNQRRGAEVFASQLGATLDRSGWRTLTVAVTQGPGESGLDVPVIGRDRLNPMTLWRLARLVRAHDVVIAHGSSSLLPVVLVAKACRRPFVYRNIGDPRYWGDVALANLRIGSALRSADRIVALSETARAWLARQYRLDDQRLAVIPNGVEVDDLLSIGVGERRAARIAFELDDDADVLGYIGSLSAEKRPEWAVAAVAARPGAVLLVAGDGPMREELEQLATRIAPGRVRFVGVRSDVRELYAAIDLLLLPSVTEGMPAVAIEAALSGVPTVATDVGSVREVVADHRTGALVDASAPGAFVEAVGTADLSARLPADVRRDVADRFGMQRVATMWADELDLLRRRRR